MTTDDRSWLPAPLVALTLAVVWALCLASLQGCEGSSSSPTGASLPTATPADWIRPFAENPSYWEYRGAPILLLGGSDQDNLFNHPDLPPHGLEAHLDLLASVGGNYVRNTMSSRNEGNVHAFLRLEDGRYDLSQENPEYWERFERFLDMAEARGIVVQIEIWDRFDYSRDWENNPFNPRNNVSYTEAESGLPSEIHTHPGQLENPFFRSTPGQEDNLLLLGYQRAFVERMLSISLRHPNVLYTISNETNESPIWSAYWADFVHERAREAGVPVYVTEMWFALDLGDPMHDYVVDDPERYGFFEASQNNMQVGQDHWDNAQALRKRLTSSPRPINSVKIYSGTHLGGGGEEGTRKFWRNILGGMASSRFHRPGGPPDAAPGSFGIGLNELARAHIRSMRMLSNEIPIFSGMPREDLLSNRAEDQAYAMAQPGHWYAVYFPAGGTVILRLAETPGFLTMRWLDILASEWSPATRVSGGGILALGPPMGSEGPWVALLVVERDP